MKPCHEMTDTELIEALTLAGMRARLAVDEDLRSVVAVVGELALEAADRLGEILAIAEPLPTKDVLTILAETVGDIHGREDVRAQARAIAARISAPDAGAGGRTVPASFMPGPLLGKIFDVSIDEHGTLTARLKMNGAGRRFLDEIKRGGGDPADGIGFRS
jgi:hypothetical protein